MFVRICDNIVREEISKCIETNLEYFGNILHNFYTNKVLHFTFI